MSPSACPNISSKSQADRSTKPKIILRFTLDKKTSSMEHMAEADCADAENRATTPRASRLVTELGVSSLLGTEPSCEPDPFNPGTSICNAVISNDDRRGVSHFFGRNKKATATIPTEMYPLLCRSHYQEKKYRYIQFPGRFAEFQCACIVKTLKNINAMTFVDDQGNEWPWFCGFELRLSESTSERLYTAKMKASSGVECNRPDNGNTCPSTADEADQLAVPAWLRLLCSKQSSDTRYSEGEPRNGVKYNIVQLIRIVRAMSKWCVEKDSKLPGVEALPVTIGTHFQQEYDKVKKELDDAKKRKYIAQTDFHNFKGSGTMKPSVTKELEDAAEALSVAHDAMGLALADLDPVRHMIPGTRRTKARKSKRTDDGDTNEGDEVTDQRHRKKIKKSLAKSTTVTKMNVERNAGASAHAIREPERPLRFINVDTATSPSRSYPNNSNNDGKGEDENHETDIASQAFFDSTGGGVPKDITTREAGGAVTMTEANEVEHS